jgi:hypothetical protein
MVVVTVVATTRRNHLVWGLAIGLNAVSGIADGFREARQEICLFSSNWRHNFGIDMDFSNRYGGICGSLGRWIALVTNGAIFIDRLLVNGRPQMKQRQMKERHHVQYSSAKDGGRCLC